MTTKLFKKVGSFFTGLVQANGQSTQRLDVALRKNDK